MVTVDLDALFPHVSRLVHSKGEPTLTQRAANGEIDRESALLTLDSCCWAVLTRQPEWSGSGPQHYLATLDEFMRRLPEGTPIGSVRNKVRSKGSGFLDMVVEAGWALHFWDSGYQVSLEEPLDPGRPRGKNADFVVRVGGGRCWLDATSVSLDDDKFRMSLGDGVKMLRHESGLVTELAQKARAKYQDKFELAAGSGMLGNDMIGILLCVIKADDVSPHLLLSKPEPPHWLFDDQRPGLDLVCVHRLRPVRGASVVRPQVLTMWQRSVRR